jgi:hypothetical protein
MKQSGSKKIASKKNLACLNGACLNDKVGQSEQAGDDDFLFIL